MHKNTLYTHFWKELKQKTDKQYIPRLAVDIIYILRVISKNHINLLLAQRVRKLDITICYLPSVHTIQSSYEFKNFTKYNLHQMLSKHVFTFIGFHSHAEIYSNIIVAIFCIFHQNIKILRKQNVRSASRRSVREKCEE